MRIEDKLTILVCSCDSYSDLWPPFFTLFKEYWPDNTCKIILNTETKTYSVPDLNITTYCLGSASFGQRMLNHLDRITTPYVLILLDDFFIRRPVNPGVIESIVQKMDNNDNVAAMTFDENPYYDKASDDFCGFVRLLQYAPYKLNMQAGIWRVSSLKRYWAPDDNPWIWEIFVNCLTYDSSEEFWGLKDKELSPVYYGYNTNGMGVYRGKWVVEDVKPLFDAHGIYVDYLKRGIYKKEEAVNRLPVFKTMPYVFKRIPFKYAFGFSCYTIWNKVLGYLGLDNKHQSYAEYLATVKH